MYYLFTANSVRKSGRPKSGRNELFSWLGKSRFLDGKGQLPARAHVSFGAGRTENPVRACPLKEEGGARKRRGPDHGCAALVWPARARCFWVRKDEETWSYRSSRPESGQIGRASCRERV